MAVVAADMFALLVGIVASIAASAQAGYLHSPSGAGGRPHSHTSHYGTSYSRPGGSYVASHNTPYAVRSLSAPIGASQSASVPVVISQSDLYPPSNLQAPYMNAHYSSSQNAHLPSSQSIQYATSQSALPSSQNFNYLTSQSVPAEIGQGTNYAHSQSVPLPSIQTANYYAHGQTVPLPSSQSVPFPNSQQNGNYAFSQTVTLPASQSVNYALSQDAPLPSSQNIPLPSSQSGTYAFSQNSFLPSSHSQSNLYSADQSIPSAAVNQVSSYTTGQTSYAASQSIPYASSQSSYTTGQSNPYLTSQGSYGASQYSPYPASQTSYTTNSQSTSSASQVAPHASSQSATPTIGQSTHSVRYTVPQGDSDYLRQYNNGQYQQQAGSAPIVNQQGHNYQIVHHTSESNEHKGYGHSENLITTQTVSHQTGGVVLDQSYSSGFADQVAPPVKPVITKHIYFHEPPPDVEQRPVRPIPTVPPKKVYNIVFIKVPSQESNRINGGSVQALSVSQQPRIEDKTLIYVLVKKPEPQPLPQPSPVSSGHEVFYVKYKGDVNEVANQVNGRLSQQTALKSDVQAAIEPVLQAMEVGHSLQPVQQSLTA